MVNIYIDRRIPQKLPVIYDIIYIFYHLPTHLNTCFMFIPDSVWRMASNATF